LVGSIWQAIFIEDLPRMLPTKFWFICQSDFREFFLEINQSETRIVCGGHVCKRIATKWALFIKDLPVVTSLCQRQCELLPSLGARRPSAFVRRLSFINYSHFNLLLWNAWTALEVSTLTITLPKRFPIFILFLLFFWSKFLIVLFTCGCFV
jgi:hypothetical protein